MKNKDLDITRSDYLFAIKFGKVDNTDFAVDFFQSVKEECDIEIVVCNYFTYQEPIPSKKADEFSQRKKVHLQCHIMNSNNMELSELITKDTERVILSVFDKLITKHNIDLQYDEQTERRIIPIDFTRDARWFLIDKSCAIIEKYLHSNFGFDTVVLAKQKERGVPTHIVAFKSAKDMDDFVSNNGIESLKERFAQYIEAKDYWKVFKDIAYLPNLCLTSNLNEDQRYALARERSISI